MDGVIVCQGLGRSFGRRAAVRDLTFVVEAGVVFGFLGPNGAGKTTTVRLLLGLLPPTTGSVRVFGLDPVRHGEWVRSRTGVLLDQVGLYERMTAWQNLDFAARVLRLHRGERYRRIQEVLERVQLWDRRHEHVSGFSKGMRQKLGLARALLADPQLLVMEEPPSGLDPANVKMVRDLISSLAREGGRTIFLCTHHLDEAQRICHRVGIIQAGHLIALGSPEELGTGDQGRQLRLVCSQFTLQQLRNVPWPPGVSLRSSTDDGQTLALELEVPDPVGIEKVVSILVRQGAGIREVVPLRRTLEDVYLDIVRGDRAGD